MSFVSPSGRYYLWDVIIAHCQKHPGWHMLLRSAPAKVVKSINLRRSKSLRRPDGRLEAQIMNVYSDDDGVRRGDVLLKWHPSQRDGRIPTPSTSSTVRVTEQEHNE